MCFEHSHDISTNKELTNQLYLLFISRVNKSLIGYLVVVEWNEWNKQLDISVLIIFIWIACHSLNIVRLYSCIGRCSQALCVQCLHKQNIRVWFRPKYRPCRLTFWELPFVRAVQYIYHIIIKSKIWFFTAEDCRLVYFVCLVTANMFTESWISRQTPTCV